MFKVTKYGICIGSLALASAGYASISFNIAAGTLRDGSSTPINSGLVILAVSTEDSDFAPPTATEFLQGDDMEVARWNFSEGGGVDGEFLAAKVIANYDSLNWAEGDPLALYWYPTLNKDSAQPDDGSGNPVKFGVFADPTNSSTGDAWAMPADNQHLYSLQFFAEGSILNTVAFASEYAAAATLEEGVAFDESALVGGSIVDQSDPALARVMWDSVVAAQQYRIERKQASAPDTEWKTVGYAGGSSTTFDDDLVAGLTFVYRVVADSGLGPVVQGSATNALEAARSVFTGIAATGYVDNSAPYTLLNGGIIIKGADATKKIITSGIAPYNASRYNQQGQWVTDPSLSYNVFQQPLASSNLDWIYGVTTPIAENPDFAAIKATMNFKSNITALPEDPDLAYDAVLLEDLPIDTPNIFKVRSLGDDKGRASIEVYDAEYSIADGGPGISDNRIYSISSRSWFPGAGAVSNASITIEGDVPKEVLAIAQGPSISPNDPESSVILPDPLLRLQKFGFGPVYINDNWREQTAFSDLSKGVVRVETDLARIEAALVENNHNPDDFTKDSVMLVTLLPGSYVFRVFPADGTRETGSVLIALSEYEAE